MINEIGNRYGRLTVVSKAPSKVTNGGASRLAMWVCVCDCGMTTTVSGHDLRRGNTTTCGCGRREALLKANTKHGDSKRRQSARLYRIWANINTRCTNPKNAEFNCYGGKGIRNEFESYEKFKEWAFTNGYHEQPEGTPYGEMLSIDRIDASKSYNPENCRWISLSENAKRREHHKIQHGNPSGSRETRATTTG